MPSRDTQHLALLIDERDEVLENLEIAETRYISSFRTSTPDPSIADLEIPHPEPERIAETSESKNGHPEISRPRPLNGATNVRPNRVFVHPLTCMEI